MPSITTQLSDLSKTAPYERHQSLWCDPADQKLLLTPYGVEAAAGFYHLVDLPPHSAVVDYLVPIKDALLSIGINTYTDEFDIPYPTYPDLYASECEVAYI